MVGRRLVECLGAGCFDLYPSDSPPTDGDAQRWSGFLSRYAQAQEMVEHDFPPQLDIELNRACNFACSFCEHGHKKFKNKKLGFDTYKRLIDEASSYGLVSLKLNYINEPLLIRDLEKYIEYAKSKGVLNVYLSTNGSLLTRDRSVSLIEAGLSKLMVSLDATTSDMFFEMRQSKDFDRIEKNIHAFVEERDKRGLSFPLLRVNFLKTAKNESQALDFMMRWESVADMVWFQEQHAVPGVEQDLLVYTDRDDFKCKTPFKLMVVDSLGDIIPCCTFQGRSMKVGNVSSMTLKEAWDSSAFKGLRSLHMAGDYKKNPLCVECVNGCA